MAALTKRSHRAQPGAEPHPRRATRAGATYPAGRAQCTGDPIVGSATRASCSYVLVRARTCAHACRSCPRLAGLDHMRAHAQKAERIEINWPRGLRPDL